MTLGQWPSNIPLARIREEIKIDEILSASFEVREVFVISRRGNEPFEVRERLHLASDSREGVEDGEKEGEREGEGEKMKAGKDII